MPVPQSTKQELNAEVRRLQHRGYFVDTESAEYRTLERKIRALMGGEDRAAAYSELGALRGLAGDVEGLRANFINATRLSSDPVFRVNYAIVLNNLGYFSEAAKDLPFCERPDNGQLEKAILLNTECGRFRRAAKLIGMWNELHQDGPWCENNMDEAGQIVEAAGLEDNAFLPCLDIAGRVLRQARLIFYHEPLITILRDEGKKRIGFQFLVRVEPQVAAELESKLVDELFSSDVELYESTICFGFLAVEQEAKQAA